MSDSASHAEGVRVLTRALDQAVEVLDSVRPECLDWRTPCEGWDVAALADHLVATPGRFLALMRGEKVDWAAPPPHVAGAWGAEFRQPADELARFWEELVGDPATPAEWQVAELAVHTWDLATAIDWPVDRLDPEVALVGLAFLQASLRAENRSPVFGPEQPAPEGADEFVRLAAFAGRAVG